MERPDTQIGKKPCPQVSIIVLTYHADPVKLRRTLAAAAAQQQVSFEILICDDGSGEKDFSFLEGFMAGLGVSDWTLIENPVNQGTVANCLSGLERAEGKYVFFTSPGDILFDPLVMRDFFRFAEQRQARLLFGNSVFYGVRDGRACLTRSLGTPACPRVYGDSPALGKRSFFAGSWVIGAGYFRERQTALTYLRQIADCCRYMEDTPSTAFALADGLSLCYYDRNMVWYEDGTGVSTGASEKWTALLRKDLQEAMKKLKKLHPGDPWVDLAYRNAVISSRPRRILGNLLRHPVLSIRKKADSRRFPVSPISCTPEQLEQLDQILCE